MTDGFYKNATAHHVARWMTEEFQLHDQINQKNAVDDIRFRFGEQFVTETKDGGWSINKDVRDEFQKLNPLAIYVWWGWKRYNPDVDALTETLALRLVNAKLESKKLRLVKATTKRKKEQFGEYYLVKADSKPEDVVRHQVNLQSACRKLELLNPSGEIVKRLKR